MLLSSDYQIQKIIILITDHLEKNILPRIERYLDQESAREHFVDLAKEAETYLHSCVNGLYYLYTNHSAPKSFTLSTYQSQRQIQQKFKKSHNTVLVDTFTCLSQISKYLALCRETNAILTAFTETARKIEEKLNKISRDSFGLYRVYISESREGEWCDQYGHWVDEMSAAKNTLENCQKAVFKIYKGMQRANCPEYKIEFAKEVEELRLMVKVISQHTTANSVSQPQVIAIENTAPESIPKSLSVPSVSTTVVQRLEEKPRYCSYQQQTLISKITTEYYRFFKQQRDSTSKTSTNLISTVNLELTNETKNIVSGNVKLT
jgi:hypothetical protein